MQALDNICEEIDDAQRWTFCDRRTKLLRGDGSSQEQEATHASQFLLDKEVNFPITKWLRISNGMIAAKLKRRKENLPFDAKLQTKT